MKRLIFLLILGVSVINAKFYAPQFEDQFNKWIKRHALDVVHFNPLGQHADNAELDRMKVAFKNLSDSARYKDADIGFVGVDLTLLPDLATVYNIVDQESTLVLFKDGKPFKADGQVVQQTGFLTKSQMRNLIETHFGELIDGILEEKQSEVREQQQARAQQAQTQQVRYVQQQPQVQYVSYPAQETVYYERPYYGGYYGGYGRPWRRGWGGWGWGPGIGVGFGGRHGGFGIGFGW